MVVWVELGNQLQPVRPVYPHARRAMDARVGVGVVHSIRSEPVLVRHSKHPFQQACRFEAFPRAKQLIESASHKTEYTYY